MSEVQRIVIRQGLQADIPALIIGEMGWDVDKKVLRVGDNSPTPVKILTDKSLGDFDFSTAGTVKFSGISLSPGGTFAGINLDSLNTGAGIVVRSATSGVFTKTSITSGDGTISVFNGSGIAGAVDLRLSSGLLATIAASAPISVTAANVPPSTPRKGDLWYDTDIDTLYIRINDGTQDNWIDISNAVGNSNAGITHTVDTVAPTLPANGDLWYNTTVDLLFIRTTDGTTSFWLQV